LGTAAFQDVCVSEIKCLAYVVGCSRVPSDAACSANLGHHKFLSPEPRNIARAPRWNSEENVRVEIYAPPAHTARSILPKVRRGKAVAKTGGELGRGEFSFLLGSLPETVSKYALHPAGGVSLSLVVQGFYSLHVHDGA
jgi:hypothetical protein